MIDPSSRNYLYALLQKTHEKRMHFYMWAWNLFVFLLFVGISGSILYYRYKEKPTDYERQQKMLRDQEFVLSKIRFAQEMNEKKKTSNITDLPLPTVM